MCIAIIAAVALLAPLAAPAEDSARIYVYALTPGHSWLPVSCGGAVVAKLKADAFFAMNVAPGRYTLSVANGTPASVEVRSGEESFVRLDWHLELGLPAVPELHSVRPDQARKEMRHLSYIDAGKVLSDSVSKRDPRDSPQRRLKTRDEPPAQ